MTGSMPDGGGSAMEARVACMACWMAEDGMDGCLGIVSGGFCDTNTGGAITVADEGEAVLDASPAPCLLKKIEEHILKYSQ